MQSPQSNCVLRKVRNISEFNTFAILFSVLANEYALSHYTCRPVSIFHDIPFLVGQVRRVIRHAKRYHACVDTNVHVT